MKHILRRTVDDGMPGVVPTLAADDDVGVLSKKIDDFPFALVAPLGSNQNGVCHIA